MSDAFDWLKSSPERLAYLQARPKLRCLFMAPDVFGRVLGKQVDTDAPMTKTHGEHGEVRTFSADAVFIDNSMPAGAWRFEPPLA